MESLRLVSEEVEAEVEGPAPGVPHPPPPVEELLFRLCLELAPSLIWSLSSRLGEFVRDLLEAFDFAPDELLEEYPEELFLVEVEESEMEPSLRTFRGWKVLLSSGFVAFAS